MFVFLRRTKFPRILENSDILKLLSFVGNIPNLFVVKLKLVYLAGLEAKLKSGASLRLEI